MAEAIGITSGLLTLATVAFQSSVALLQTIQSFRSHLTRVRGLLEEVEALTGVLQSLSETIRVATDLELSTLELPLQRCGNACKEFEEELIKCSARSSGDRTSFRDWAKLRYMGDNIDGFRQLLAGYKSTIVIALTDANLRKTNTTTENLESYKELVKTATDDLEAHLQSIDEKLETLFGRAVPDSSEGEEELQRMKEDRLSTQKCLQICGQLSRHIEQIQLSAKDGSSASADMAQNSIPERLFDEGLEECKASLASTTQRLETHMKDLIDRLLAKAKITTPSDEDLMDLARLRDEWDTARQCVDICSKANMHLKESVSTIDNYGTGDAVQFMVSTNGKTIHGRNKGLGWRTRQLGGHVSDASLQKVSSDFALSFQNAKGIDPSPQTPGSHDSRDSVVYCETANVELESSAGAERTKNEIALSDDERKQSTAPGTSSKPSSNQSKKRFPGHDTG